MKNKKKKVKVIIKTYVNGPFNFKLESQNLIINECEVSNCYIVRNNNNNNIELYDQNIYNDTENYDTLFRVRESFIDNSFEIINPLRINMQKNEKNINNLKYYSSWYVITNNNLYKNYKEDYNLNENDIIKLGNKIYKIIKKNINITNLEEENQKKKKYNISGVNEKVGPIFDINLKDCQNINVMNLELKIKQNEINSKNNTEIKKNENEIKCRKCKKLELE